MARFYGIDEANEQLPEVREILGALRDQRAELIRLRDEILERQAAVEATADGPAGAGSAAGRAEADPEEAAELRRIRLRMQGVIDQMQAGVVRLDALSITLRDIETGLIDFPALVSGRQVCLCWRLGEDSIGWWHELTAGFSGRRSLADLD